MPCLEPIQHNFNPIGSFLSIEGAIYSQNGLISRGNRKKDEESVVNNAFAAPEASSGRILTTGNNSLCVRKARLALEQKRGAGRFAWRHAMMMIAEISSAIASIKNLGDLIGHMKESSEKKKMAAAFADVQDKMMGLQSKIIETSAALAAAEERAREAEKKCMQMEDWQHQASRYQLKEIVTGIYAYALKPGMEEGEPVHYLCATCYQKGKKSILQFEVRLGQSRVYKCHECASSIRVSPR
jgi:hypothetical protein